MDELLDRKLPCFRCGVCCTRYQVCVNRYEAQRLADHLDLNLEVFLRDYTDPRWPGTENFLIRHRDGACVFLENIPGTKLTGCCIHDVRPQDCRNWTPGIDRSECLRGLEKWGLKIGSSGDLEGTSENISRFSLFLESIKE